MTTEMTIRALTVYQPYASLMLVRKPTRAKANETRPWATKHRGLLVIHAAAQEPGWVRQSFMYDQTLPALMARFFRKGEETFHLDECLDDLPRGAVLGTVVLDDVRKVVPGFRVGPIERALGDYTLGRYAWMTSRPAELVDPLPWKGRQGLWKLPAEAMVGRECRRPYG